MTIKATKGACTLCGKEYTRSGMAKHLACCLTKQPTESIMDDERFSLHLQVTTRYPSGYWLHLQMDERATFKKLDTFLRKLWLECCGHMSQFFVGRQTIGMQGRLATLLRPGDEIDYDYDMGDTTELQIKVLGAYQGLAPNKKSITILARNQPPEIPCDACDRHPAVSICPECNWEGEGWLCRKCTTRHSCGDAAGYLPIPNSPRAGVCGYTGA
ncbi:hypothetical protein [Malonomonas rubra]|uniref:hypothetical protein n=1 Tax=Malonomonas rubra TaxID=57040 RepID=UPI0026F1294A|nr:hypothetical protein [Malonomonas rubra]